MPTPQQVRENNINVLLNFLKKSKSNLLSEVFVFMSKQKTSAGCRRITITSYLQTLYDRGDIYFKGERVFIKPKGGEIIDEP